MRPRRWKEANRQIDGLTRDLLAAQEKNRRLEARVAAFEAGAISEKVIVGDEYVIVRECAHVLVAECNKVRMVDSIGEAHGVIFTDGSGNRIDRGTPEKFGVWLER